jgi:hypothetical protein
MEENTIEQLSSGEPASPYRIGYGKGTLQAVYYDHKSSPRSLVVVPPTRQAQCAIRPLPPIPSSPSPPTQTHLALPSALGAEERSLHVDELNVTPIKSPSKVEKALLRKIEFGLDADDPTLQLC